MPITGKSPQECFAQFRKHLSVLLSQTVPTKCTVLAEATTGNQADIGFREGNAPKLVPIATDHGKLFFWVSQVIFAEPLGSGGRFKLRTERYWYRLQDSTARNAPSLIRWEYDRNTPRNGHCRHHVQQKAEIELTSTGKVLDVDKLHVPSGWVTIEEVLRFLIHDLGMKPPCGHSRWPKILHDSEKKFREEFSTPY